MSTPALGLDVLSFRARWRVHDPPRVSPVPRVVEFLTELRGTTVLEGEDATFKCVVSPEDVQLLWFMDNEAVALGDRFQAHQNGLCRTLVIRKCQMSDCSKITAEAEGQRSKASLKVQGQATERRERGSRVTGSDGGSL